MTAFERIKAALTWKEPTGIEEDLAKVEKELKAVKELYETIKQKRDNAENKPITDLVEYNQLTGKLNAYNDVLSLIENSGVLDDVEKEIN